jgi:hypothetical protein
MQTPLQILATTIGDVLEQTDGSAGERLHVA